MLLTVKSPIANIYKKNNKKSEIVTQILLGEHFVAKSKFRKFYKGYKSYDKYKGFIEAKDLHLDKRKKTHKIISKDSSLYKKPSKKYKTNKKIFFNSKISILNNTNVFIQTNVGWILKKNVKPINFKTKHFLDNIKLYLNTKYLWGGNSPKGLDCSALVQELLKFNNIYCPRDSKDQKKFFKKEIAIKNIKKGDFLFWKGHVAIALNNKKLVHAFGARKKVVMMGIKETITKIYSKSKLPLLCVKRIKKL
jgi:cell wall-associated NlpC family hydrolase